MFSRLNIHFDVSERKILLRTFDVLSVIAFLYVFSQLLDFQYFSFSNTNYYGFAILIVYLNVLGTVFEMYNLQVASSQIQVTRSIALTALSVTVFFLLTPILTPVLPNRLDILYFFAAIFCGLFSWRFFYEAFLASHRFMRKVVLICDREQLLDLVNGLKHIDPNYKIVAYLNPDETDNKSIEVDIQVVTVGELTGFVREESVSEIVIASNKTNRMTVFLYGQLLLLLEQGFTIREYWQVYEYMTQRIPMRHFDKDFYRHFPFSRSNQNKLYLLIVRVLELLLAIFGLAVTGLLLPFIVLGNLISNRGKLFYLQERVGKNGKNFRIYKFRTMVKNAEHNGAVFASSNDVRITPFGKILRKSRIDELPQFLNILKGEMGFIGPRPERPVFVRELSRMMPFYTTRHVIKPGLTGWAQVMYPYGQTMDDSLIKLQYDLYYIKHRSVFLDLNIIVKTFSTVLFYRGQ